MEATKKIQKTTKSRVEKVEEAIQEHAKKIQQMEEDIAKMNAGGTDYEKKENDG